MDKKVRCNLKIERQLKIKKLISFHKRMLIMKLSKNCKRKKICALLYNGCEI